MINKNFDESNEMSDINFAIYLAHHIDYPCGCEINGEWKDIRPFYLKMAEESILKLKNPFSQDFLRAKIRQYSK